MCIFQMLPYNFSPAHGIFNITINAYTTFPCLSLIWSNKILSFLLPEYFPSKCFFLFLTDQLFSFFSFFFFFPLWASVWLCFDIFGFLCTNKTWKMLMWPWDSHPMRILLSLRHNTICRKYKRRPKVSRSYWLIDWFWSQWQTLLFLFTPRGAVSSWLSQHAPGMYRH